MADKLLLEDGTSRILLEDGVSFLLLESVAGGFVSLALLDAGGIGAVSSAPATLRPSNITILQAAQRASLH